MTAVTDIRVSYFDRGRKNIMLAPISLSLKFIITARVYYYIIYCLCRDVAISFSFLLHWTWGVKMLKNEEKIECSIEDGTNITFPLPDMDMEE
jgi:hypothetical protein